MSIQNNPVNESFQEITTIARGASTVFVGTIIGTGLRYLFRALIGRYLGPALVGLFFIGLGVFRISEKMSCLGIQNGVLRYVALYRGEGKEQHVKGTIVVALRIVLGTGILSGLVLFLAAPFIANTVYHNPALIKVLRIFSLAVPFTALTTILVFSTQSFRIMKYKVAVRELFEPLLQISLFFLIFQLGYGLLGAISAFVFAVIMGTFLAFFFLRKTFPDIVTRKIRPVIEPKKLLTFSWPLFFVGFFYLIILWLNTLLVGFFMESRDVGIFGAAHNTAMLGQVVLIAFVSIFAPMVSDLHNRKQLEKLEHLFKIVTKWIFLFSFPIFVLMVYYAEEILALTFGKDFVVGARCLEILSLGLLINSLIASSGILTSMSGRPKLELYNLTAILVINVLLSFILIPRYGIIGAAYSTLIAFVSLNILRLLEVYYLFKIHPFRFDLYKPFLSGCSSFLIMVLAAKYLFPTASTFLSLVLGACVYIGLYILILILFGIEEEDKIVLSKIREKVQLF